MRMRHTTLWRALLALLGACAPMSSTNAQPCTRYWADAAGDYDLGLSFQPALAVFDDGTGPSLYTSGHFRWRKYPTGRGVPCVGRWRGERWELLTSGLPRPHLSRMTGVRVLDDGTGPKLYTGIQITTFSAPEYRYEFYVWNGAAWSRTPPGMYESGYPRVSYNDGTGIAIFGMVNTPGQEQRLGKWVGDHWQVIGTHSPGGATQAMCVYDSGSGPELYVAGTFNAINGVSAWRIARWNGTSWRSVGNAVGSDVNGMVVYDDGSGPALFTAGYGSPAAFGTAVGKWDGHTWSVPGGGIPNSGPYITTLHYIGTHDDGRGMALYVGGYLSLAGGTFVNSIARWDGHAWEALGGGLYPGFGSMVSFDDGHGPALYVSTEGGPVGATTNSVLSKWVGCPNCYADCNRDGRLDVIDFLCFQDQYARGDAYANCTVDTRINVADYICFMNKYAAGCP
ncbi:MAG: hypothetical protein ACKVW3_05915 [Phycisphaerales bacterium]